MKPASFLSTLRCKFLYTPTVLAMLCLFVRRAYRARYSLLSCLCLLLVACERPLENPELSDRIYNDMLQDAKSSHAAADAEKTNLESIEKEIADSKMGDNTIKAKFRKKYDSEFKIAGLNQKLEFLALRTIKRKEYVLLTYPKYYEKHLHWPDAEEWNDYQAAKRLQEASRIWDKRVPRLGKRIKDYNDSVATKYSTSSGGEAKKKPNEGASAEAGPTVEKAE